MFAREVAAGVEQLPLLVTQRASVTLRALTAVRLRVQRDALSMDASGDKRSLQSDPFVP